jgi:hypothetical protein
VLDRPALLDESELPIERESLTLLQADAFVTLDAKLARRVRVLVETATLDALR